MATIRVDVEGVEWTSGVQFYGPGCMHEGKDLVRLKILCDRRHEGGGISWIARFEPPPGKLIKIVAMALSDEHVFGIQGGRATKTGAPAKGSGGYSVNTEGQAHSAMIATETTSLIIYTGEPDEVRSIEVVDIAEAARRGAAGGQNRGRASVQASVSSSARSCTGPLSRPLAPTSRSISSITAMSAASP